MSGRKRLADRDWLADRYATASSTTIADELGVAPSTVVNALHRHGVTVRSRWGSARLNMPPEIDDADWLRKQYKIKAPSRIAAELGVSSPLVYKALERLGIEREGPWVRRDTRRLRRPPKRTMEALWRRHGTLKGISRELGVAHTTAAVWLADVGIFLHDAPAISRSELERHIAEGHTIDDIAAVHRVTDRTVMIELRRFGLVEAHRHRPRTE